MFARPHAWWQRERRRSAALQQSAGRAAGAALTLRAGPTAHILPQARGPRAGAPTYREHVPHQPTLLDAFF